MGEKLSLLACRNPCEHRAHASLWAEISRLNPPGFVFPFQQNLQKCGRLTQQSPAAYTLLAAWKASLSPDEHGPTGHGKLPSHRLSAPWQQNVRQKIPVTPNACFHPHHAKKICGQRKCQILSELGTPISREYRFKSRLPKTHQEAIAWKGNKGFFKCLIFWSELRLHGYNTCEECKR